MTAHCDGCRHPLGPGEVHVAFAEGHEAHYCLDCHAVYRAWVQTCAAEETRLNRLLEMFLEASRERLALDFVPQDLPPVRRGAGAPLVLG